MQIKISVLKPASYIFAALMVVGFNVGVGAESTLYKQRILPIDCLYEVIDAGTQTLRFLTPETCPIEPIDPPFVPPAPEPAPDGTTVQPQSSNPLTGYSYRDISSDIAVAINPTKPSVKGQVVWMPKGVKSYPPVYRQAEIFSYVIGFSIITLLFTYGYLKYKRKH